MNNAMVLYHSLWFLKISRIIQNSLSKGFLKISCLRITWYISGKFRFLDFCPDSLYTFFFFNLFILFIYLFFLAVLGLRFCARAFSSRGERGPLFIAVRGPHTVAASLVAEHRLQTRRLRSVAHGPSCSAACGIFPDQGSNPCPLHWQADSQPLRHQGSPV